MPDVIFDVIFNANDRDRIEKKLIEDLCDEEKTPFLCMMRDLVGE